MSYLTGHKDRPQRVAMLVHAYYLRDARVRRYAEALVAQGVETDVFCLRDAGEPARESHLGVRIIRVPYTRSRGGKLSYYLEYATSLVLLCLYLTLFHVRRRYVLVHVHTPPDVLILAAVMTRSLGRAKLVLDYHDLMPELYCAKYRLKQDSTQVRLLKWVEQVSATLADAVLTACDTFKENLVLRGVPRSRVYVIRNLPDSRLFQPDRDAIVRCDPIFTLLYLGTLSERYGVDLAIRALAILRLRIPRIKLRIIGKISGEGDYKSTLQELATKCGVEDLVEFLQPVPLDEVSAEIAACDVGVYTPVRDVHMDNAFSLKAGEFAAMRVPMVTTRTPVMESHLGPSGAAYIDAGDIQGFVAQVVRLHSDSGFYGDLVRASEEFTRLHNWDAERQLYLNVVNGLIQTRFR